MLVVWYPLFEHPCCNAKGDVYAKERILRVDDGTLEDALYAILQFIEEFTGMVTVKFFENGKLYNTIDIPMPNDLLKKFDESQLKSSVSRIKLIRYIDDEEHIDIQINVIKGIYDSNILRDLVKS
ncbi:MAG: hypothetical protein ACLT3T_13235 [Holdemanella porci]